VNGILVLFDSNDYKRLTDSISLKNIDHLL